MHVLIAEFLAHLQSMAKKGYNPLSAIQIALADEAHKVWGE